MDRRLGGLRPEVGQNVTKLEETDDEETNCTQGSDHSWEPDSAATNHQTEGGRPKKKAAREAPRKKGK
jgi:hypothetical protein